MKKKPLHSFCLPTLFMAVTTSRLPAGQGDWDTTFAGSGRVTTHIGYTTTDVTDAGHGLAVQKDGRILLAGYSAAARRDDDFAVVRYNTNGTLDTSFNATGYVRTSISTSDYGYSLALQQDGKILVAGTSFSDFALVRYNSDGSLDQSFNATGKVLTDMGGGETAKAMAVQSDGKIVLAGTRTIGLYGDADFAVARYHPDGSLDTAFGSGGTVLTDFGSGDAGNSIAVQADGRIVVAGDSWSFGVSSVITVARYTANGSLDTSFNGSGKLTMDLPGGWSRANSVTLQADGKILVAGKAGDFPAEDFAIIRINRNGTPDADFSGDGVMTTDFAGSDYATGITVQPGGKFIVAGVSYHSDRDFAVARYNADGSLDTTFHGTGKVVSNFTEHDYWNSIAVQRDGNIVAGGHTAGGFSVGRYLGESPPAISIEYPPGERVALPVSFGEVAAGAGSSRILTVRNTGNTMLTEIAVTLSATGTPGDFTIQPLVADSLVAGATMEIEAGFSPGAPGWRSATLLVSSSATPNPLAITLEGTQPLQDITVEQPAGTGLTAADSVPVSFGPVLAGGSANRVFTIRNSGGTALTAIAVTKTAAGTPGNFALGSPGVTTLAPNGATTFSVTFTPPAAGVSTATFLIASNDPDENPFEIHLTGSQANVSEVWRQTWFGSPYNTGAGADVNDPDSDGIVNLIEFATGSDPTMKSPAPGQLEKKGNTLEFTYTRPVAVQGELTYGLEASTSLSGIWSSNGMTTSFLDDGVTQVVKVTTSTGSLGRRYVRLRITRP